MEICRKTNLTFDLILSCMILDREKWACRVEFRLGQSGYESNGSQVKNGSF